MELSYRTHRAPPPPKQQPATENLTHSLCFCIFMSDPHEVQLLLLAYRFVWSLGLASWWRASFWLFDGGGHEVKMWGTVDFHWNWEDGRSRKKFRGPCAHRELPTSPCLQFSFWNCFSNQYLCRHSVFLLFAPTILSIKQTGDLIEKTNPV